MSSLKLTVGATLLFAFEVIVVDGTVDHLRACCGHIEQTQNGLRNRSHIAGSHQDMFTFSKNTLRTIVLRCKPEATDERVVCIAKINALCRRNLFDYLPD